jgi:hypothetical protein
MPVWPTGVVGITDVCRALPESHSNPAFPALAYDPGKYRPGSPP